MKFDLASTQAMTGDSFMQCSFNARAEGYSHIFTAMINGIIFHGLYLAHVFTKGQILWFITTEC